MDSDIRQILNSLFSKNVSIDEFGFIQIPDEVVRKSTKVEEIALKQEKKESETKIKKKCGVCNKKTGLDYFVCGEDIYCSNHRYHHTHNCKIDIKKEHQLILSENNPKIIKDKLERI